MKKNLKTAYFLEKSPKTDYKNISSNDTTNFPYQAGKRLQWQLKIDTEWSKRIISSVTELQDTQVFRQKEQFTHMAGGGGGEEVKLDQLDPLFYGEHSLPEDKIAVSTDFLAGSPNFTTKQNILWIEKKHSKICKKSGNTASMSPS